MGRELLSTASYKQMKGRAGRKGQDISGESFLCYSHTDQENILKLVNGEIPAISSCLGRENRGFERALLEAVVANLATSHTSIVTYSTWTLYYHQTGYVSQRCIINSGTLIRFVIILLVPRGF